MDPSTKKRNICAAWGCNNYQTTNKDVSYFHFPNDKSRCDRWVVNIRRQDLQGKTPQDLKRRIVCGAHFEESQFINSILR